MDIRDFSFWGRQARAIETIKKIEALRTMRQAFGLSAEEYTKQIEEYKGEYYSALGEKPMPSEKQGTTKDSRTASGWDFFRKVEEG